MTKWEIDDKKRDMKLTSRLALVRGSLQVVAAGLTYQIGASAQRSCHPRSGIFRSPWLKTACHWGNAHQFTLLKCQSRLAAASNVRESQELSGVQEYFDLNDLLFPANEPVQLVKKMSGLCLRVLRHEYFFLRIFVVFPFE